MPSTARILVILSFGLLHAACAGGPGSRIAESGGASRAAYGYMADIRGAAGLARAVPDSRLERAAEEQARLMAEAGRMAHTARRGRDFTSRMRANGIGGKAAENIANGRMPMTEVFDMWKASPPHRRNMLDPAFTRYGLASATTAEGRRYWALVLAN
ncbi:MAG: CAP domain-containing protein [Rhizobiaceae bacterium]|nr:CAP domain-containing protein [Rhizobiaceae bacterium]MCV0408520.1 CAP domain-containing protein [Rhizobiaceae bacterium]